MSRYDAQPDDTIDDLRDKVRRSRFHERENYARWQAAEARIAALATDLNSDAAAVLVAKAFGGYDDLEWARLEPRERAWLCSKGYRALAALAPVVTEAGDEGGGSE